MLVRDEWDKERYWLEGKSKGKFHGIFLFVCLI